MIQFNLLPEVKIQYLKAKRQQRMVVLSSTIAIAASIVLVGILLSFVFGVQRKSISDLDKDIASASSKLEGTPDLTKILTVQNQLKSLPDLHNKKPVATRLFGYVTQFTPNSAKIARLNVDFAQNSMSISGSADSLETVNKFTDTLKFTNYNVKDSTEQKPAFSDVVLSNFGRDNSAATYTIVLKFDPAIFSEKDEVTMVVPNIISTRSQTEQPTAIFESQGEDQ